jgi:uncharacterized membrane protein (TIGR02234 family)
VSPRRLYGPVVLATLAAGGLAFFAASRTWARVEVATDGLPSDVVEVTGTDAQPLVPALALVVVTAALAVLAASARLRRVVGVLTVLVSVGAIVVLATGGSAVVDAARAAVELSPAYTGSTEVDPATSPWRFVAMAAFAFAALLGAVTVRFAGRWPTMGARFEAPGSVAPTAAPETSTDIWKALDEGRDPTQ